MNEQMAKKLAQPFSPEKVKKKRGQGNRMMDYISHGLITERLNDVDPEWSWRPIQTYTYQGTDGEHEMPEGWTLVRWKAKGGYGSQGEGRGRENAARECVWFSPQCRAPTAYQPSLFAPPPRRPRVARFLASQQRI